MKTPQLKKSPQKLEDPELSTKSGQHDYDYNSLYTINELIISTHTYRCAAKIIIKLFL